MLRTMKRERHFLPLLLLLFVPFALSPSAVFGQNLPCQPCGGVRLGDPTEAAAVLDTLTSAARFKPGSPLFVAWDVVLDGAPNPSAEPATAIHAAGATPWLGLVFRTPSPLAANIQRLQTELSAAARIAADAPSGTYFQVTWRPDADVGGGEGGEGGAPTVFDPAEYAFLLKQAAVAITGYILMFPFYGTTVSGVQLAQIIHGIVAALFIAAMLGHIYIGTIGMEGAFEAMGTGEVDVNWAKEHHKLWLEEEMGKGSSARAKAQPAE